MGNPLDSMDNPVVRDVIIGTAIVVLFAIFSSISVAYRKGKCPTKKASLPTSKFSAFVPYRPSSAHEESAYPWKNWRLPSNVRPVHYDILLQPNFQKLTFTGHVAITILVKEPTDAVVVHSSKLNVMCVMVNSAAEFGDTGHSIEIYDAFPYPENEYYVILFSRPLENGHYRLIFDYFGLFNVLHVGFYRCWYFDPETRKNRDFAMTHFAPNFARRTFPCFDEPSFKATFTFRVNHPTDLVAISSMNVENAGQYVGIPLTNTSFKPSMLMSTCSLGCLVSNFVYEETTTMQRKIPVRIHTSNLFLRQVETHLMQASKILEEFERLFKINYPLPKHDMIAVPEPWLPDCSEQWGLATYQAHHLLFNPVIESSRLMERHLTNIAQMIAQEWFGNLVTIKWWDHIWLKEGPSTFFAYHGIRHVAPDLKTDTSIVVERMQGCLVFDSFPSSCPVIRSPTTNREVAELCIKEIDSNKGALLLRMMESFLGKDRFTEGVQAYLKSHAFDNAESHDLWRAMKGEDESLDVEKIMDTWTLQKGFPLITVCRKGIVFTATQNRFLEPGETEEEDSPFNYRWEIPLSYKTKKQLEPRITWMHADDSQVEWKIDDLGENDWIKFNVDTTGFYRVNYDMDEWERLTGLLHDNHEALSVSDRTGLLDDAFEMARKGLVPYEVPMKMISYMEKETKYEPWKTLRDHVETISGLLQSLPEYERFKTRIKNIIHPIILHIKNTRETSADDAHTQQKLENIIGKLSIKINDTCLDCQDRHLNPWLDDVNIPTAINNFSQASLNHALSKSTPDIWNDVWQMLLQEQSAEIRLKLLKGLSSSSIPWLLHGLLNKAAVDGTQLSDKEFFTVAKQIAQNPVGQHIAWNFFRNQWPELARRFTLQSCDLAQLIVPVTSWFTTEPQLHELESFLTKYPKGGMVGERYRQLAKYIVKNNISWQKTHSESLREWLRNNA